MYEMFLSYSGQSGGSLLSVHMIHVISCSKADDADQLKHRKETFNPVIKLTCRWAGCAMAHLW